MTEQNVDDVIDALERKIEIMLGSLSQIERTVIVHRYGLLSGFTRTHEEVADSLGVSAEEVHIIDSRAVSRLGGDWPGPEA